MATNQDTLELIAHEIELIGLKEDRVRRLLCEDKLIPENRMDLIEMLGLLEKERRAFENQFHEALASHQFQAPAILPFEDSQVIPPGESAAQKGNLLDSILKKIGSIPSSDKMKAGTVGKWPPDVGTIGKWPPDSK